MATSIEVIAKIVGFMDRQLLLNEDISNSYQIEAIIVEHQFEDGETFNLRISSGLDSLTRKEIWLNKDLFIGKRIKFKCQPFDFSLPRFPFFLGFEDKIVLPKPKKKEVIQGELF